MNISDNMLTASSGLNIQIRLLICNTWVIVFELISNLSFDSILSLIRLSHDNWSILFNSMTLLRSHASNISSDVHDTRPQNWDLVFASWCCGAKFWDTSMRWNSILSASAEDAGHTSSIRTNFSTSQYIPPHPIQVPTQPDLRIIWPTDYRYITNFIDLICKSWAIGSDTEH